MSNQFSSACGKFLLYCTMGLFIDQCSYTCIHADSLHHSFACLQFSTLFWKLLRETTSQRSQSTGTQEQTQQASMSS